MENGEWRIENGELGRCACLLWIDTRITGNYQEFFLGGAINSEIILVNFDGI